MANLKYEFSIDHERLLNYKVTSLYQGLCSIIIVSPATEKYLHPIFIVTLEVKRSEEDD